MEKTVPPPDEAEKTKKTNRVRSAWISFVGRIVAQIIGAAATIVLGVLVLQKAQAPRQADEQPVSDPEHSVVGPSRTRSTGSRPTLAVLPLDNFSGNPDQNYFADGMTDAIIAELAKIKGLRVISRTSSMAYKRGEKALPAIAQDLGADLIVEGSVLKSGNRVRVTAQLIDAGTDAHLWTESYDHTIRDVFVLQARVAAAIAREVTGVLATDPARLAANASVDPAVYDLYLRGRYAWNLRTVAGFRDAIQYFQQAVAQAPDFALAHAGLSDAYQLLGPDAGEDSPAKARAAAARALELDEGLAEAHTSLGAVLHRGEGDVPGGEHEFRRALELNPGYATAHQWYAVLLAEEGRDQEALDHALQAVALDPLSPTMRQTLALTHYYGRRYGPAAAEAGRAFASAPRLPLARDILGRSMLAQGNARQAISVWEQEPASRNADALAMLGVAYLQVGNRARADWAINDLLRRRPMPYGLLARWYAATGNRDAALERLQQLVRQNQTGMQPLKADPIFDGLRSDPRFTSLFKPS